MLWSFIGGCFAFEGKLESAKTKLKDKPAETINKHLQGG